MDYSHLKRRDRGDEDNGTAASGGGRGSGSGSGSSSDGSPWQAMKRLRVAEDRSVAVFPTTNGTSASAVGAGAGAGTVSLSNWGTAPPFASHHDVAGYPLHHFSYRDSTNSYRQDAGQDTMSEGMWDRMSPSKLSPMKQSKSSPLPSQGDEDDVDYNSVNHILGALHLGRRQREEQQRTLSQQSPSSSSSLATNQYHVNDYNINSTTAMPTPPPSSRQATWNGFNSYYSAMTPPPKPTKRKGVVQLPSNSKLG